MDDSQQLYASDAFFADKSKYLQYVPKNIMHAYSSIDSQFSLFIIFSLLPNIAYDCLNLTVGTQYLAFNMVIMCYKV